MKTLRRSEWSKTRWDRTGMNCKGRWRKWRRERGSRDKKFRNKNSIDNVSFTTNSKSKRSRTTRVWTKKEPNIWRWWGRLRITRRKTIRLSLSPMPPNQPSRLSTSEAATTTRVPWTLSRIPGLSWPVPNPISLEFITNRLRTSGFDQSTKNSFVKKTYSRRE